jgi:hypothetical protein
MITPVSFSRLNLPFKGKGKDGKRKYQLTVISEAELVADRVGAWRALSAGG